jgi:drug/metabolite transporter (DMT)-like permease
MSKRPPAWRADLALVAVSFVWGATFIMVKQAVGDMPVLLFLTLRFTIAAAVLAAIFGPRKNRPSIRPSLRPGIILGTLLFSGYVVQTFGLTLTSAAKTGFITGFYIPLVPIFGAMLYRKRPQSSEVAGVVLAFIGTALMSIQGNVLSINRGDLLVAGCAVIYAFHIVLLGHFAAVADVAWLAVVQIATGAVLGWLTFWWAGPTHVLWTPAVWIALAVTSILATAFAFTTQTWAQKYTTATRAALIFSLEPVFAWITSYVAVGEVLTTRALAGAGFVLAGILMAELKPLRPGVHQPLSDSSDETC